MKDKREIGYCDDRLEKSQYFLKKRVIKLHFQRVNNLNRLEDRIIKKGQATKSARGMPWHWEPMKDVVNCDKLRGVVSRRYIRRFPNGAT